MKIQELTQGLSVSSETFSVLENLQNKEEILAFASSISCNYLNDEYKLAGRMEMYAYLKHAPTTVEEYIEVLGHRFSQKYIGSLRKYQVEIDEWISKNHDPIYTGVKDYIAASKFVKDFLLGLGYGSGPGEIPAFLAIRVALEQYSHDIQKALEKAHEMFNQYYTHATPTLINSGTPNPQLGSCFLGELQDSAESILQDGVYKVGIISKNNGGLGLNLNNIRQGAIGFSGMSNGLGTFTPIIDKTVAGINQNGTRKGAATLYVRDYHIGMLNLCQSVTANCPANKKLENVQAAVWMSDLFMERVRTNGKWTMFDPHMTPELTGKYLGEFEHWYHYYEKLVFELDSIRQQYLEKIHFLESKGQDSLKKIREYNEFIKTRYINFKQLNAKDVMDEICDCQIRDGPYIMWCDSINFRSQVSNIGPINCSNLCTEIVEHSSPTEIPTCNLGSLNIPKYVTGVYNGNFKDCFDFKLFGSMVKSLVENIDRVIDVNKYPLDQYNSDGSITQGPISRPNYQNRPMGLGVSGLYNALVQMKIPFDSELALKFNEILFACMYWNALNESFTLGQEYGVYETCSKGTCKIYNPDINDFETLKGSPLYNGYLQFDLVNLEREYLRACNRLVEYDDKERPICVQQELLEPRNWGDSGEWEDLKCLVKHDGIRNSLLIAPMPTATTANMMGNVEAFEAPQGLLYSKFMKGVNATYIVPEFIESIKKLGIWNEKTYQFVVVNQGSVKGLDGFLREFFPDQDFDWNAIEQFMDLFKTAFEVNPRQTIKMAQGRSPYVDQSMSMNLFVSEPTIEIMSRIHDLTNKCRLKTGIYYLRQPHPVESYPLNVDPEIIHFRKVLNGEIVAPLFCSRTAGCESCSS